MNCSDRVSHHSQNQSNILPLHTSRDFNSTSHSLSIKEGETLLHNRGSRTPMSRASQSSLRKSLLSDNILKK